MIWFNKQLKHFALVIVLLVMWDYNASGFKNSRILHFVFMCNFFAPSHNEGACEGKKRIQELRSKERFKCNNKIVKHFPTTSKYSIVLCCLLRWILLCVWQSEGKPKISLELALTEVLCWDKSIKMFTDVWEEISMALGLFGFNKVFDVCVSCEQWSQNLLTGDHGISVN